MVEKVDGVLDGQPTERCTMAGDNDRRPKFEDPTTSKDVRIEASECRHRHAIGATQTACENDISIGDVHGCLSRRQQLDEPDLAIPNAKRVLASEGGSREPNRRRSGFQAIELPSQVLTNDTVTGRCEFGESYVRGSPDGVTNRSRRNHRQTAGKALRTEAVDAIRTRENHSVQLAYGELHFERPQHVIGPTMVAHRIDQHTLCCSHDDACIAPPPAIAVVNEGKEIVANPAPVAGVGLSHDSSDGTLSDVPSLSLVESFKTFDRSTICPRSIRSERTYLETAATQLPLKGLAMLDYMVENADRTDRLGMEVANLMPAEDTFEIALALRIIRCANLIAERWGLDPGPDEATAMAAIGPEALESAVDSMRFIGDMEKQDLRKLLIAVTIACGDMPGPEPESD